MEAVLCLQIYSHQPPPQRWGPLPHPQAPLPVGGLHRATQKGVAGNSPEKGFSLIPVGTGGWGSLGVSWVEQELPMGRGTPPSAEI